MPKSPERQQDQQLILSLWAWGEDEPKGMNDLDHTFRNLTMTLREVSVKSAAH